MAEKFSLKDRLFNRDKVSYLAGLIFQVDSNFKHQEFIEEVVGKFPELELKERIEFITDMLQKYLYSDFKKTTQILLNSLPKELDPEKTDDDFGDFIFSPFSVYISRYGCNKQYLHFSLDALKEITKRFSVEFDIRFFINNFEQETFNRMLDWSMSENYHVRRLASEGTRPNLPWAKKINLDYKKTIAILNNLFSDKTRYVTRSVANHLNDISKLDSKLVVDTLKRWKKSGNQELREMDFIISHSLRGLVKSGDRYALEFLGYHHDPKIVIRDFNLITPNVIIGKNLEFSFDIISKREENLIVDYVIHFVTNSSRKSTKVFKIKKISLKKGEKISILKAHPLRVMTTKKLYPGEHKIELQINGKIFGEKNFNLI